MENIEEVQEKKEKTKSTKNVFVSCLVQTMMAILITTAIMSTIYLFCKVGAFLKSNLVDQGSLLLKTGIGDIQMTGLMPTLFTLFYLGTLTIAFVMVFMTIRAISRKRAEKEGVK